MRTVSIIWNSPSGDYGNVCIGRGISIMSRTLSSTASQPGKKSSLRRTRDGSRATSRAGITCTRAHRIQQGGDRMGTEVPAARGNGLQSRPRTLALDGIQDYGEDSTYQAPHFSRPSRRSTFLARSRAYGSQDSSPPTPTRTVWWPLVTSKLLTYGMKATDLTADNRLTNEKANQISYARVSRPRRAVGFSSHYESMDTPADRLSIRALS